MNTTKAQLVSQFLEEIKVDPNKKINSETLIVKNLNIALRTVQEKVRYGLPENQKILTFALTGGEYTLPADFAAVAEPTSVKKDQHGYLVPADYVNLLGTNNMSTVGSAQVYYVRMVDEAWVFGTYPVDTGTITFPYLTKLPEISDTQDSPLPSQYDTAIVYYAVFLTMKRIRGFEAKAKEYLEFYEQEIRKVLGTSLMYNRHALRVGSPRNRNFNPNGRRYGSS